MGSNCETDHRIVFGKPADTFEERIRVLEWIVDQEANRLKMGLSNRLNDLTPLYNKIFSSDFPQSLRQRLFFLTDKQAKVLKGVGFFGQWRKGLSVDNFTVSNCTLFERLFRGEVLNVCLLTTQEERNGLNACFVAIRRTLSEEKESPKVKHWVVGWFTSEELQRLSL